MRALSLWFAGVGLVQVAHVSASILGATLPPGYTAREAPVWAAALVAGSAWLHLRVSRAARERKAWARNAACALIAAWAITVYLEVNTESVHVGEAVGSYAATPSNPSAEPPPDAPHRTHADAALGGSWSAVGWPAAITHPYDYVLAPSGVWGLPEILIVVFQAALAVGLLGSALSKASAPLPDPDPSDGRAVARHALAALREDARRTPALRVLGWGVAAHLAFLGVYTLLVLFGLSAAVMKRAFHRSASLPHASTTLVARSESRRDGPCAGP